MNPILEKYRVKDGKWKTLDNSNYGMFSLPTKKLGERLRVLCSHLGELDWDHVSVSVFGIKKGKEVCVKRCPTWEEMSKVKNLFWSESDTTIQFHPKKSKHINNHPYVLHLWKKTGVEHELPPSIYVGLNDFNIGG